MINLAIVIPYYKYIFFEATIQSLANQTNQQFQVYIGDDASTESPSVILKKFEGQLRVIYQRFENNLGGTSLVSQWERCIDLVNDESWIMILGDDDVLDENVVEEFYKQYNEIVTASKVVRYATVKIDGKGCQTSLTHKHPTIEKSTDFIFRKSRSSLSEHVFKKETLIEVGFVDLPLAWFSDILAILEVSEFNNIYTINEAIVKVRVSEHSISGSKKNIELKTDANFKFYDYLLKSRSNHFTKVQVSNLEKSWQRVYFYNKKNIYFFTEISSYFLKKLRIKDYMVFLFYAVKSRLKA